MAQKDNVRAKGMGGKSYEVSWFVYVLYVVMALAVQNGIQWIFVYLRSPLVNYKCRRKNTWFFVLKTNSIHCIMDR